MYKGILKVLMVILNSAIFVAGVAALIFVISMGDGLHLYLLVAVGAVLIFTGFLGCCGACCENQRMLMLFFNINLVAFVAEVVAVAFILIHKRENNKLSFVDDQIKRNPALMWGIAICVTTIEVGSMLVSFIMIKKEYFKPVNIAEIVKKTNDIMEDML